MDIVVRYTHILFLRVRVRIRDSIRDYRYIKKTWSLSDPARNASGSVFVLGEAEGPQPQSVLERPRPGVWYGGERACGKAWHCRASFRVSITLWFQGLSSCALKSP